MAKVFAILLSVFITSSAMAQDIASIASTIHNDVFDYTKRAMKTDAGNYKSVQFRLHEKLNRLDTFFNDQRARAEIQYLKDTLQAAQRMYQLRLQFSEDELTTEELLQVYFEMKAVKN